MISHGNTVTKTLIAQVRKDPINQNFSRRFNPKKAGYDERCEVNMIPPPPPPPFPTHIHTHTLREKVKPWDFFTFSVIKSHIFSEIFNEISQVVLKM